jgi:hypothetical protein
MQWFECGVGVSFVVPVICRSLCGASPGDTSRVRLSAEKSQTCLRMFIAQDGRPLRFGCFRFPLYRFGLALEAFRFLLSVLLFWSTTVSRILFPASMATPRLIQSALMFASSPLRPPLYLWGAVKFLLDDLWSFADSLSTDYHILGSFQKSPASRWGRDICSVHRRATRPLYAELLAAICCFDCERVATVRHRLLHKAFPGKLMVGHCGPSVTTLS